MDFIDVSDDFKQKTRKKLVQNVFGLRIFIFFMSVYDVEPKKI